jgi:uncharacterized protein YcfJ
VDVTLWFDPETGAAEQGNPAYDPPVSTWKVIRQGEAISVLARNAKDAVVLIASGSWTGMGVGKRDEVGDTLTDRQWGKLEHALRTFDRGEALAGVDRSKPPVRTVAEPGGQAADAKPTRARDGRSGWWVFGAGVVALVGCLIAWKAQQPDDATGKAITYSLGILAVGLLGYSIYGGATRCPSCHAWFKRKRLSTENMGTSTESREETTSVKDSAGNVVGSTSQYVTYNVTTYHYHYSCKACRHRWTLSGTSKSRA